MTDRITLQVERYRPEQETEPTWQSYEIPLREDWSVLDGLNYVKDHLDGTLSYRWSCRMGICGSCGMNVEGTPQLTCATFLSDYAPGPVRVEPLANFPIVRDLVVDINDFMEKLPKVKPWIIRDDLSVVDGEYLQTPEELAEYKHFSNCINCMLCYAACPVYGLDESFIGPAAIALAERYDLDSRDRGRRERLDVLIEREGVWGCTFVGECTRVCPKHVDPAGAIQRYKLEAAKESVMVFLMMLVYAIGRGEASYLRFLDWASAPIVVAVNVVALGFLVLHTVTWFALTPQAVVARAGGRQVVQTRMVHVAGRILPAATVVRVGGGVPAALVIASQYLGLAVVSVFIAWLV